jgi:hypothetical protein
MFSKLSYLLRPYFVRNYPSKIMDDIEGNNHILKLISSKNPLMVSRLGAVELRALTYYLLNIKYSKKIKLSLSRNAGFFPTDNENIDIFCKTYLKCLKNIDHMLIWNNFGEDYLIKKYCPKASMSHMDSLESYRYDEPWSSALSGKKVLVIHPFEESILKQYKNREKLFKNNSILPEFELITLKAVQSIADNNTGFKSWFEALDSMKMKIDLLNFDIALIGAGAYGLPLAAHIKNMGKQAIHMGGLTQILFGIMGSRWENNSHVLKQVNEYWVRPNYSEIPKNCKNVENGCYW